mmetsp:Transcript_2237/g.4908  ORF Transcript_2237/g.4908 Transcript_2237/m.4908 type:complete len:585 (+) Transcript_2237:268-2022(+)
MAISIATNYSGRSASVSTPASTETINRNSSNREAESSLQKQLSLLVLIRCLRTAQLAPPPIVVPFYQNSCHLEPSAILWLGSWYSALVAACEFPSGVLSDVLGRKTTLQLAFIGLGLCWIVTYGSSLSSSSSSMIVVWLGLAQIFRAVGSSLYSGTDMALLYELLKKHKTQNQNQKENPATRKGANGDDLALKLESRQVVLSTITEAVVAALGGLLSRSYGDATVILMSALPPIMGATICFGLEETATSMDGTIQKKEINGSSSRGGGDKSDSTDQSNAPSSETIQKSKFERRRSSRIVDTLNQRSLHIIFGVGVVLNCATYVAATALNPLLWQQVGISNFAGGLLQATNSGVTALGALAAPTLKRLCSRRIGHKIIGSGGGGGDDDEYADIDDYEDEDVLVDDDAAAGPAASAPSASSETTTNIVKTRTYDLSITYDKYYQVPRVWMVGRNEDDQPLTSGQMMEDVISDYANKTVTMEVHPHVSSSCPHASIHPCQHAKVMKAIVRNLIRGGSSSKGGGTTSADNRSSTKNDDDDGNDGEYEEAKSGPSVENYLFIFLKFVSSMIPTINYDFTMEVTADTSKY